MPKLTTALLCAVTLLSILPAQRGGRQGQAAMYEHYTFAQDSFASDKLSRGEGGYFILLPKGHDDAANADKIYQWILWLPGFGGPIDVLQRGGGEVLDQLRGAGAIDEVALVVFRASSGGRRGGRSIYMNGEAAGDTEYVLTNDLLQAVQKKYRLSNKREHRALMGVSAGGFGALKIAMRHPDKFAAVAVHSAAVLPADPAELEGLAQNVVMRYLRGGLEKQFGNPIDKSKWQQHMPLAMAANMKPADLKGLQIYFDAGTDDRYGFFEPNQKLSAAMTANGHKHLFRPVEEGGHAWSSAKMKDNVRHSLLFVAAALRGKDAIAEAKKKIEAEAAAQKSDAGDGK